MTNTTFSTTSALLALSLLVGAAPGAWAADGFAAVGDKTLAAERPKLLSNPTLLTLNLANADVRTVLDTLIKKGGMNMIMDDSVMGQITLNLKAVPLDDALNLVLKMKSLSAKRMGSTLLVATDEVFRKKGFSGTSMSLLRFDNAKIGDVEQLFRQALEEGADGGGAGSGGAASGSAKAAPGGASGGNGNLKILRDERTNSLLIFAPEETLETAKTLKTLLDVPTPQVEIEVKMLELSEGADRTLGISYGFGGSKFGAGFNNSDPNTTAGGEGNQAGNPSTGGTALTYAALGNFTANFNARLDALVTNRQATIMANPKVMAQDNKAASIQIVNKHPVLTSTTTTTGTSTSLNSIDVGQSLNFTPRIGSDGYVTLELKPEISVESSVVIVNGNPVPVVDSRNVSTTMRVRDNESIVIGGLMRKNNTNSTTKIPFLGDLPILGALFRTNVVAESTTNIVIIVTPHIQQKMASSVDNALGAPRRGADFQGLQTSQSEAPAQPGSNQGTSDAPPKF